MFLNPPVFNQQVLKAACMSSRVSRVQREKKKRWPHPKHPGGVDAVSFFLRSLINGLLGQAAAAVLVGAAGVVEFLLFHFSPPPS